MSDEKPSVAPIIEDICKAKDLLDRENVYGAKVLLDRVAWDIQKLMPFLRPVRPTRPPHHWTGATNPATYKFASA